MYCPGWCGSVDWAQACKPKVAGSVPSQGTQQNLRRTGQKAGLKETLSNSHFQNLGVNHAKWSPAWFPCFDYWWDFFFFKILLIYFRKRGKEGEQEGEKHSSVVSRTPPTWSTIQAYTLTGNWTAYLSVCRPPLNPLSHTSHGLMGFLIQ